MNEQILAHIEGLIQTHKQNVIILYSEIKLRLPSYLRAITIKQLREIGATVDPDITFPKGSEDRIRKYASLHEKINHIRCEARDQVTAHYNNLKGQLPKKLLEKRIGQLTDDDWKSLGIDIVGFRATLAIA